MVLKVKDFTKSDAKGFKPTVEIEIQWGEIEAFTVVLPVSARSSIRGSYYPLVGGNAPVQPVHVKGGIRYNTTYKEVVDVQKNDTASCIPRLQFRNVNYTQLTSFLVQYNELRNDSE